MAFGEGTGKEMRKMAFFYEKAKKIEKKSANPEVTLKIGYISRNIQKKCRDNSTRSCNKNSNRYYYAKIPNYILF